MRRVSKKKLLVLSGLLLLMLSTFSFAAYKAGAAYSSAETACTDHSAHNGQMFWDALAHKFVSTLLLL
jgi:Spy/CpxP family protein refolding chaperone